ncbi:MAG: DinB family protein [Bacteroidota bacterium]
MRPQAEDHIPYFSRYIDLVPENSIMPALQNNHHELIEFIKSIPADKSEYKYSPEKWTIKQVINHIIDTERIFSYRALRFARGDAQRLPGFEENYYAANANLKYTNLNLLTEEFDVVRKSTILLFKQLDEKELLLSGLMAAGEVNVLSLGFTTCGHAKHHMNVMQERYLS